MKIVEYLLRLLFALLAAAAGETYSLTVDEARFNTWFAPQIAGESQVYIDFIPNGFYVNTTLYVGRRSVQVGATAPVMVQEGKMRVFVTAVWVGNRRAPDSTARLLNQTVIPRLNAAFAQYDLVYITEIEVTDTNLHIDFMLVAE